MKKVIVIEWLESGISKGFAPVLVEKTKRHQMFLDDKNKPKIFKSRKEAIAFVKKWFSTCEEIFDAENREL